MLEACIGQVSLWKQGKKLDLREIGWDDVGWIDMADDRDQWRALVNTVFNLQIP
jgi:hypothetical protein